jgi:hypothetical protein
MPDTPSREQEAIAQLQAHRERVWNALIPRSAVAAHIIPQVGVAYLHPTKGWRIVGKRRFAIRGVV